MRARRDDKPVPAYRQNSAREKKPMLTIFGWNPRDFAPIRIAIEIVLIGLLLIEDWWTWLRTRVKR